jgi:hypothetical protein
MVVGIAIEAGSLLSMLLILWTVAFHRGQPINRATV